jgi:drug/metabolite transporter (DMT)-like permease
MSDKPDVNEPEAKEREALPEDRAQWPLPGMIVIGLYMLLLAAVVTLGVAGRHLPLMLLVLAPFFVAASFGMLRMYRWAWALTLSAVFLLMSYNLWLFAGRQQSPAAVQGLLNLVLFLYLVRMDVRKRLR